jgi:hypothetical protein
LARIIASAADQRVLSNRPPWTFSISEYRLRGISTSAGPQVRRRQLAPTTAFDVEMNLLVFCEPVKSDRSTADMRTM